MSELSDLYQEVILDHAKMPRKHGTLDAPTGKAEGYNPLCGDQVNVTVQVHGDVVEKVRHEGAGCAISVASASIMSSMSEGKTLEDFETLFEHFQSVVTGKSEADEEELGSLIALAGVKDHPSRIKCATLAWHTMKEALQKSKESGNA